MYSVISRFTDNLTLKHYTILLAVLVVIVILLAAAQGWEQTLEFTFLILGFFCVELLAAYFNRSLANKIVSIALLTTLWASIGFLSMSSTFLLILSVVFVWINISRLQIFLKMFKERFLAGWEVKKVRECFWEI